MEREDGECVICIGGEGKGEFEGIGVGKDERGGVCIEKVVMWVYAKGMRVCEIEEEMGEIYEIEVCRCGIWMIRKKVNEGGEEWEKGGVDGV